MYDLSDFLDYIAPDRQVIDGSSWLFFFVLLAGICVAQRMLRSKEGRRFPFLIAALLSLGVPAIFRLFLEQQIGDHQWRLGAFFSLYPDFITNCLLLAACGEMAIAALKVATEISVTFDLVLTGAIPLGIWMASHLSNFDAVAFLVDVSFWLTLVAVVFALVVAHFARRERSHDCIVLSAGLAGVFLAANLLRFTPASTFTANQIETVSIASAFVALLSISGFWLLLEGNKIMLDQHLIKLSGYE